MKTKSILTALLLMVVGMQTVRALTMRLWQNEQPNDLEVSSVDGNTLAESYEYNHEWVDLGLPSGTLWATCNVGANSPEEYGNYFAWGETKPRKKFAWSAYFDTEDKGRTFKKYNNNGGLTELLPEDDAATANWGSGWQMPSFDQVDELTEMNYTTIEWMTLNGKYGCKITSKSNGKSIFLPAAGYRDGKSLNEAGSDGYYWSRSLYTRHSDIACSLYFASDAILTRLGDYRYYGQGVRPVRVK